MKKSRRIVAKTQFLSKSKRIHKSKSNKTKKKNNVAKTQFLTKSKRIHKSKSNKTKKKNNIILRRKRAHNYDGKKSCLVCLTETDDDKKKNCDKCGYRYMESCPACKTETDDEKNYCDTCNYPYRGDKETQRKFIEDQKEMVGEFVKTKRMKECPACKFESENDKNFCLCGYPYNGTQEIKEKFMEEYKKMVDDYTEPKKVPWWNIFSLGLSS
jgi:hypothetical protein